ncbi:Mu transposase C-terminal domain-containing protein [Streptomyces sp. NBC_01320]|uniref:Mu transposase C-terminal domain-containing protein n=1 Tax=Streptomyces sp. NBC_01320 TaxID=2903824 RepID=UPI003FA36BBE
MLAGATRIVQKDGINFQGLAYVAPELDGRGGQRVQIRYSRTTTGPSRFTWGPSTCAPLTRPRSSPPNRPKPSASTPARRPNASDGGSGAAPPGRPGAPSRR